MQEFRQDLKQLVGTIAWQDAEQCKAAAKEIMDSFSEASGNMARSIIMNGIYQGLYAGFDAVSDTLQEKGIDRRCKMMSVKDIVASSLLCSWPI